MADVDISAVGVSRARIPSVLRDALPAFERSTDGVLCLCGNPGLGAYEVSYANDTVKRWLFARIGIPDVGCVQLELETDAGSVSIDAAFPLQSGALLQPFAGFGWIVTRDGARHRSRMRVMPQREDADTFLLVYLEWHHVERGTARAELVLIEEAGLLGEVSDSLTSILGFERPKLGLGPLDLAHPEDVQRIRAVQAWLSQAQSGEATSVLFRARHAAGGYRWLGGTARVVNGFTGAAWQWNLTDVSEMKARDEELRATRAFLTQARSVAGIGTFRWALARPGLVECSEEAERVFGVNTPEELEAVAFEALCHQDDLFSLNEAFTRARREAGQFEIEYRLQGLDGSQRWVRVFGGVAFDLTTQEPLELIGVVRDMSEHRRLQSQSFESQKMEALGRLAGSVAHDFNNMLSAIQGFARFIHDDVPEDSAMREDAAQILRASTRAAALTQQLLAFGRRQVLEPRVLDVREQIRDMEKMLSQLLPEHARLRMLLSNELDRVKVDPVKLEQVILNLVVNAREAMPRGGTITLETRNVCLDESYANSHLDVAPGAYVMLAVTDTGVGMSDAVRNRIFEPFFTTKEAGRGTGLGLATVFGIIKQSGGHLAVYSELGRGSVFKVYFPSCGEALAREVTRPPVSAAVALGETVLVVEDEASVRELVQRILLRSGFRVLTAASPEEALSLEERHTGRLDVLVTDVVMPGMSGPDLALKLRRRRPELITIYMSGYTENTVEDQGVPPDGQWFVPKPIDPEQLLGKLQEASRFLREQHAGGLGKVTA